MNFFWKLYLTIMLMVVSCFSVGGYMLIEAGFKSGFLREKETAYQENDILYTSFVKDLTNLVDGYALSSSYGYVDGRIELVEEVGSTLTIRTFSGNIPFCLRDKNGEVIYRNSLFTNDVSLIEKVEAGKRGYKLVKDNDEYKIYVLRKIDVEDVDIYLENSRDISSLFKEREEQYLSFLYNIGLLSLIGAIVIFIVTRWLVKPINKLSCATKQIVAGKLSDEIVISSNDEIGQLTRDFNTMSKRLVQSMDELQDAVNRQEVFVANFAHELKTPLTSMIGYGDMIRSKRLKEEQVISFANLIVQEGKRLESLSMKLMELVVLKKQDFMFSVIDVVEFFYEVEAVVKPIMEDSKIEFVVKVEAGFIFGESDLLKTLCLNLLDNARKAVGEQGKIEFLGFKENEKYLIVVRDNGCGIKKQEINKIKEAFYMVDKSRSRNAGGAGLGLAICDQVVKLHGGNILIESEIEKGTKITVLFKEGKGFEEG